MPATTLSKVLLPAPFGPTTAMRWPAVTCIDTASMALRPS